MGIIGIASSGMEAAMAQLNATAQNIASGGTLGGAGAARVEAIASPVPGGGVRTSIARAGSAIAGPADELISTMAASLSYRTNASVIRAAEAMIGTLIDMAA